MEHFTICLDGKPTLVISAEDQNAAQLVLQGKRLPANLSSHGLMTRDSELSLRPASTEEREIWVRTRADAIAAGEEDSEDDHFAYLVPVVDRSDDDDDNGDDGDGPE